MTKIEVWIEGRAVSRDWVLAEEMKRAQAASRKLGLDISGCDVAQAREKLLARKLELGRQGLRRLVRRETFLSDWIFKKLAAWSGHKLVKCEVAITATGISAGEFMAWMEACLANDDEAALLAAHPEHWVQTGEEGCQTVCERVGGSPLAAEFVLDSTDGGLLAGDILPDYPYHYMAQIADEKGAVLGGALHQLRDGADGLEGRLCIYFPKLFPNYIIKKHRIHLAIEFSNWLEMAAESLKS